MYKRQVQNTDPERFKALLKAAETENRLRYDRLAYLAGFSEEGD